MLLSCRLLFLRDAAPGARLPDSADKISPRLPFFSFTYPTNVSGASTMDQALCCALDITAGTFHYDLELNQQVCRVLEMAPRANQTHREAVEF